MCGKAGDARLQNGIVQGLGAWEVPPAVPSPRCPGPRVGRGRVCTGIVGGIPPESPGPSLLPAPPSSARGQDASPGCPSPHPASQTLSQL